MRVFGPRRELFCLQAILPGGSVVFSGQTSHSLRSNLPLAPVKPPGPDWLGAGGLGGPLSHSPSVEALDTVAVPVGSDSGPGELGQGFGEGAVASTEGNSAIGAS